MNLTGFGARFPVQSQGEELPANDAPDRHHNQSMATEKQLSAAARRAIVVLAAGQGTRMGPNIDKALVDIGGIPMLEARPAELRRDPTAPARDRPGPMARMSLEFPGYDFEIAVQDPASKGTAAALIAATGAP